MRVDKTFRLSVVAGITAFVTAGLSATVLAQDATTIDEITVTAQRRAENIQDVPIAMTVLGNDTLRERGIDDSFELAQKTPSVVFTQNASSGQVFIRGVGSSNLSAGSDPSTAVSVDGIYLSRPDGAILDFYDLERIEVLKGPQGTLYGRNATAGAVNVLTAQPVLAEYAGQVQAQLGQFDRRRLEGAVNLPIGDALAVRVASVYSSRDGFVDNEVTGTAEDGFDFVGIRANALYDAGGALTARVGVEVSDESGTRGAAAQVNPAFFSPAVLAFGGAADTDPTTAFSNFQTDIESELTRANLTLEFDAGAVVLRSITGYVESDSTSLLDLDATDVEFANNLERNTAKTLSQEFQVLSNSEADLEWVVGAYFLDDDIEQVFDAFLLGGPTQLRYDGAVDVTATALFAQGTYTIADRWHVTAGIRYSDEEKKTRFRNLIVDPGGAITGAPQAAPIVISSEPSLDFSATTPRLVLQYDVSDSTNVYLSATRGFKSGGVNLTGAGEQFDEETLWSYEAGLKSTLASGKLVGDIVAFHYDYKDLQVQFFNGFAEVVQNAANASVDGIEFAFMARPTDSLVVDFGAAILDATFSDYVTLDPDSGVVNPATGLASGAIRDLDGNTLPRAPDLVLTLGLDWQLPVDVTGSVHLVADARYQSEVFFDQFNNPGVQQDAFTLANVRASWFSDDERVRVTVFGENVFDETYRSTVIRSTALIGTLDFFGAPRTWGAEVAYRF